MSLVELFERRAFDDPQKKVLQYLHGNDRIETWSNQDLLERVQSLAGLLQNRYAKGDRVCLVYPHGLDFISALFACWYAGLIAVPCSRPRRKQSDKKLQLIVDDAKPVAILTNGELHEVCRQAQSSVCPDVINTDLTYPEPNAQTVVPLDASDLAVLQYTSGSTGHPRGVMISHANLLANAEALRLATGNSERSVCLSWLPMYHDMGLVYGILHPIYLGSMGMLLSPKRFVADPLCWLKAISDHRVTMAVGPNFSFDLCTRRITDQQKLELDLSSIEVLVNGAEPIRIESLKGFAEAFSSCGFDPRTYFPAFGMAEATLIVSGGPVPRELNVAELDNGDLTQGKVTKVSKASGSSSDSRRIVGCGKVVDKTTCLIVDTELRKQVTTDKVGEIWMRGPGVATGYWGNPEATEYAFRATLANDPNTTYLRTGDLGFVDEQGELFITGRIKDLIIVNGRNIYPQDVELVVETTLGGTGACRCAAVPFAKEGSEGIAVVVESNAKIRQMVRGSQGSRVPELEEIVAQLREAIVSEFDAPMDVAVFVKSGSFPLTTSGKIRRRACLQIVQEGAQSVIYESRSSRLISGIGKQNSSSVALNPRVVEQLRASLSGVVESPNRLKDLDFESVRLNELGLDSLSRSSFISDVERKFGIRIDSEHIHSDSTVRDVLHVIRQNSETSPKSIEPTVSPAGSNEDSHEANSGAGLEPRRPIERVDSKLTSLTDFAQIESRDLFLKTTEFSGWIKDAEKRGFKRYLLPVIEQRGGRALVSGDKHNPEREVILFASADYLGLAHDERIKRAAAKSVMEDGCNVASVPLIAGSTLVHSQLEKELSELLGTEGCVLFPTGHSANMATIAAICSQHDTVVVDNRVHYSILEGVRLAHCPWRTFLHNSAESLEEVLKSVRIENTSRGILVVAEGVYGIEGDLADIDSLIEVARRYDARLMLDDAHGIGVLGEDGSGTATHTGAKHRPDIVMGSLSKSLGSFGGFICSSRDVCDYLRFFAKSISFAVGMPPVNAAGAIEGLRIIRTEPERMAATREKSRFLRDLLIAEGFAEAAASESTIMSIDIGDEVLLRDVVRELFEKGVWGEGLPFPAVSRGQERLRFRVRYEHTKEDLQYTAKVVSEVVHRLRGTSKSNVVVDGGGSDGKAKLEVTTLNQLDDRQVSQLIDLGIEQAERMNASLPWVSREFVAKYLKRSDYWQGEFSTNQWHLLYSGGELVGGFCVDRTNVSLGKAPTSAALIGSMVCGEGHEAALLSSVCRVAEEIRSEVDVLVAPATHPVQVFGTGIQEWVEGKPFLEASLPQELADGLKAFGFLEAGSKRYCRVRLRADASENQYEESTVIREFQRGNVVDEVDSVAPIIAETLGKLDLCFSLPSETICGLVRDMRDLILPGLWLVAERNEQVVGFAFCYPNLTEEFRRVGGKVDVADFQLMQQAMETAKEAFIAWVGVSPQHSETGVAHQLLSELRQRLLSRGFTHTWISWEVVDGDVALDDLVSELGTVVSQVEMPYFAPGKPTVESRVPAPHFKRRKSQSVD